MPDAGVLMVPGVGTVTFGRTGVWAGVTDGLVMTDEPAFGNTPVAVRVAPMAGEMAVTTSLSMDLVLTPGLVTVGAAGNFGATGLVDAGEDGRGGAGIGEVGAAGTAGALPNWEESALVMEDGEVGAVGEVGTTTGELVAAMDCCRAASDCCNESAAAASAACCVAVAAAFDAAWDVMTLDAPAGDVGTVVVVGGPFNLIP